MKTTTPSTASLARSFLNFIRNIALPVIAIAAFTGQCFAFTLELDQPGGIYPEGTVVTLTVKADDKSSLADLEKVVVMANNRTPWDITVTRTQPDWQGQFTPPAAGWYVFEAHRKNSEAKEKPSAVGILVAPEKLGPARPEPADFDAFWEKKRYEVSALPLKAQLTPLTAEQKEREFMSGKGKVPAREEKANRLEREGIERWNLEIEMVPSVRPVVGYLARPTNAEVESSPVIILLHAAGIGQFWCRGNSIEAMALAQKYHAIVLDLSAHGIMNGGTSEYYEELKPILQAQYKKPENWDSSLVAGMALRLIRAIDFVGTLPEWDGKHIVCIGESQGGGQALSAAGLNPRVSGVIALVPAMCDFAGPTVGRPAGYPYPVSFYTYENRPERVESILADALYCDNIYLSKRSRAKTLIFAGLIDPTCPSPGIAAAFNAIPAEKEILFFPHKKHNGFPPEDLWIGKYYDLRDGFLKEHFSNQTKSLEKSRN